MTSDQIVSIANSVLFALFGIIAFFLKSIMSKIEKQAEKFDDRLKSLELSYQVLEELQRTLKEFHDDYTQNFRELRNTHTKLKEKVNNMQLECAKSCGPSCFRNSRPTTGNHERVSI